MLSQKRTVVTFLSISACKEVPQEEHLALYIKVISFLPSLQLAEKTSLLKKTDSHGNHANRGNYYFLLYLVIGLSKQYLNHFSNLVHLLCLASLTKTQGHVQLLRIKCLIDKRDTFAFNMSFQYLHLGFFFSCQGYIFLSSK